MVDPESFYLYRPVTSCIGNTRVEDDVSECRCSDCLSNELLRQRFKPQYDGSTGGDEGPWENLQLMLCPPRVWGYILKDKQWAQLAVDKVVDIADQASENVMDNLHLDGENDGRKTKDLLTSLVKNHGLGESKRSNKAYELKDVVPDKGKGLVVLLYGAPGVGKTLTGRIGPFLKIARNLVH